MLDASSLLGLLLSRKREGRALLVALVGAGGKTETLFALADEARSRGLALVLGTTTAMRDPRLEPGRPIDRYAGPGEAGPVEAGSVLFLLGPTGSEGKVGGLPPPAFEAYRGLCDLILVEADGSRRLPLKAPAAHEPVLPPGVDAVLACVGADALGQPLEEGRVHRLPEFLALSGQKPGEALELESLARLAEAPEGVFKGAPTVALRLLLLCKADLAAEALARNLRLRLPSGIEVDSSSFGPSRPGAGTGGLPGLGAGGGFVLVRGAGDLATGVILRLRRAGYRVGALECARPSAIRRTVSLCEAVYRGRAEVEGIGARLVPDVAAFLALLHEGKDLPLLVDPAGDSIALLRPDALVDAIMAKKNLGTRRGQAPLVLALGPGFEAGSEVDGVIETNRGHELGRVIWEGRAEADTGVPGEIGGASGDRVLHAGAEGSYRPLQPIGSLVSKGDIIAYIENEYGNFNVCSKIDGILRGSLPDGFPVSPGFKIADVDPRARPEHCLRVSDKARAIGGGVLEALLAAAVLPRRSEPAPSAGIPSPPSRSP